MKNKTKHIIKKIEPGSIAEELELEPGDELLRVNGEEIEDVFDYHFQTNDSYLELTIRKKNGEEWDLEIEKEYDKLKDKAITIETTKDSEDTSEARFKVDFDVLLQENPDTVAWIRFDEPSIISYPVVKSADNKEYLTKTFTESDNKLGAIFMDMRNTSDFSDKNTMIYGHNMKIGGEMFSQLKEYEEESFYKEHPNFYIYTPDGKTRTYTVFSAAVVKDTADQYNLTYATDEAFESYLKMCKEDSAYDTGTEVNAQSQIVSLSTCTNVREDERFLLQGVLTATDGGED